MANDYAERYIDRIYGRYYQQRWKMCEEEIRQIMWKSLFESSKRYNRYNPLIRFEEYAEKVIVAEVEHWIRENGYYRYFYLSLDKPFCDSGETMLSTYLSTEDTFCSLELFDFISRLSYIKFFICKSYILRYCDEEIIRWLGISGERLEEIKIELQQDFKQEYLV